MGAKSHVSPYRQNAARLSEVDADPVGSLKNVRLTFLMNVAEAVL
jgi:hypothetical protein